MAIARKFRITGRVQGVGYRYFAIRAATACGVTGTVRNLQDGSVEVVAEGKPQAMAEFRTQLEQGPPLSRVTWIDEAELPPTGSYKRFDVEY
jgi:acylphosphatase